MHSLLNVDYITGIVSIDYHEVEDNKLESQTLPENQGKSYENVCLYITKSYVTMMLFFRWKAVE